MSMEVDRAVSLASGFLEGGQVGQEKAGRARLLMMVIGAVAATFLVALIGPSPSYAIFDCPGTKPPTQKLPLDGKVIQVGELVEFTVEADPGQSSTCMYVAVAETPDRTPEGWYQSPIDRCHPVSKIYNDIFYSCVSENTDWRSKPGKYYWTTYKINTECFPSACYSPYDWEIIVSDGSGSNPGSSDPGSGGSETITSFSLSKRSMRRGKKITIKATLTQAATLNVVVEKKSKGRKVGRKCKKSTRKLRKRRRCTRYSRVGTLKYSAQAGKNRFRFNGKVGKRRLRRGKYRLTPNVVDGSGSKSQGRSVNLRVK